MILVSCKFSYVFLRLLKPQKYFWKGRFAPLSKIFLWYSKLQ